MIIADFMALYKCCYYYYYYYYYRRSHCRGAVGAVAPPG